MKNLVTLILLVISLTSYFQNNKKEIVYLLFDEQSNEKCKVPVEGKGLADLKKFRKKLKKNISILESVMKLFPLTKKIV